jgi:phenylpropionate dioxygenase-like ring-hydroxylating dioxygenase large terminal subunit
LTPLEDLDSTKPTPVTLLGIKLVIWKPRSSPNYQVFLDRCPHRLAPLSEGRIDEKTGNLMCSYHGWEFDDQGVCTRIPQTENTDVVTKNKTNFCAEVFPTREVNGLLWVWADPKTPELAEKTPLLLSPNIDAEKGFVWASYLRDLEYDWQTLIENLADPSHVPFAHHGVQGNRNTVKPLDLIILESTPNLIVTTIKSTIPGATSTIIFSPPCLLEYQIVFADQNKKAGFVFYCSPVWPGKSRFVGQFYRNFDFSNQQLTPRWWDHISLRHLVLEGDMILLHEQELLLQQIQQIKPEESWKTLYKMPTDADRLIIEFRKWFDRYCDGQLPWETVGISPQISSNHLSREQLLDRYHQHTQHCSSCRQALQGIKVLQIFLFSYFLISLSLVAVMSDHLRQSWGIFVMAIAFLSLAIASVLKFRLEPEFYFIDYRHPDKK